MAKEQSKKGLIITIVALGLTLLIVGGFVIWQNSQKAAVTEPTKTDTSKSEDTPATTEQQETTTEEEPATNVDPATLSSIDITPLSIKVFYSKGIGGFEFAVKRASDKTQYVEFSSPDLIGTKCTDDTGLFVSIIENPKSESVTTKTVKVGNDTYGLSLAGDTCAKDVELLKEYQTAFSNGFSKLEAL